MMNDGIRKLGIKKQKCDRQNISDASFKISHIFSR